MKMKMKKILWKRKQKFIIKRRDSTRLDSEEKRLQLKIEKKGKIKIYIHILMIVRPRVQKKLL